jgi:hypothetical protein
MRAYEAIAQGLAAIRGNECVAGIAHSLSVAQKLAAGRNRVPQASGA